MNLYRKILEFAIYTVFVSIILGIGAMIIGLLLTGIQSIYTMLF